MLDHTRHIGIFNARHLDVTLIGAGGIGAITGITLAKMGVVHINLFDDDTVDEVNLATQFHRVSDVGYKKVRTVHNSIWQFSHAYPQPYPFRVEKHTHLPPSDIYIATVDSIASRQGVWEAVKQSSRLDDPHFPQVWYLDARMGAEVFELFAVNMSDPDWYETSISRAHDDDMPDLPCTSKATIYTANMAAGHIGVAVRRIATWEQRPGFLTHDILNNEISFLEMEA